MKPELRVFTNGFEGSWPAIEYAAWMSQAMQTPLVLTGALEEKRQNRDVEDLFSRAVALFQQKGLSYRLELSAQTAEQSLVSSARQHPQALFVFGPFGRPSLRRLVMGRSFRQVMAQVAAPLLYVPKIRLPLKQVLLCMGGLSYTLTAEHLGLKVASMTGASVTLLTVVPPVDLDYPEARAIRDNWQRLAETDTQPGRVLRDALQLGQEMQVPVSVRTRSGIIAEEILDEICSGAFDLVCMGSPYSAHSLRHLYTANITADVAEAGLAPVLTARFQPPAASTPDYLPEGEENVR